MRPAESDLLARHGITAYLEKQPPNYKESALPPPDLLQDLLYCSLAGLTPRGFVIVRALARSGGRFVSSTSLAGKLGLRDRHELNRLLHNEGLPTYKELSGWIRVLAWVLDWDSTGVALSYSALSAGLNAEVYGRTVQRVTGLSWTSVRSRGSAWVLLELAGRCRLPTNTAVRLIS